MCCKSPFRRFMVCVYIAVSSWDSASNSSKHSMMFCHSDVQQGRI
ncbi:hypothetical protein NEIELOOT_02060 [Neisseria elongata subsp. glycolytica ATCC 29315]|uniref:Uncharacterized protein n=1 Tax=Neisseria elongata subsp. glycolytica ATCC 29315 TaxID=546263 RepID=D4DSL5_NEIEG|nr:hypothetical protein NEIELOOT_02060 [Neisseria elongata subsp. glycolytica ATCC 29315]